MTNLDRPQTRIERALDLLGADKIARTIVTAYQEGDYPRAEMAFRNLPYEGKGLHYALGLLLAGAGENACLLAMSGAIAGKRVPFDPKEGSDLKWKVERERVYASLGGRE